MNTKLKACPLLPQSDTSPSFTIPGESHTRTYFIRCLGNECATYVDGYCMRFGTTVDMEMETRNIGQKKEMGDV